MNEPATKSDSKAVRFSKRRWIVASVIVSVLLLVALLPRIAGSRWIYEPLLKRFEKEDFRFEVEEVQIGWFRPLRLRGLRISQDEHAVDVDPASNGSGKITNKTLAQISEVRSDRGLLSYLFHGRNLGQLEIIKPKVDIELLDNGSNLERFVRAFEGEKKNNTANATKKPPTLDVDVLVDGFSVQVSSDSQSDPLVVVPEIDAKLSYRSLDGDARLIVAPMTVLDHVVVTPELVRLGLGMAIPMLAKSAWFDGEVSLVAKEIRIPLSNPQQSTGEATLTMHQLRCGPSEPALVSLLDFAAQMRGTDAQHELVFVDGSQLEISAANERIRHSGMKAGLPKIDPRLQIGSSGSVGLADRSLELQLELPVPIEHLARRESVQQIGVPTITVPIRGTLDAPVVDWKSMRGESATLMGVIAGALKNEAPGTSAAIDALGSVANGDADQAIAATVDVIRQLRERRQAAKKKETENKESPTAENTDTKDQRRPVRGALRDLLRGGK